MDWSRAVGDEDSLFDEEQGEGMVGFDIDERRRHTIERGGTMGVEEERRLSRDLEEGFKDESDEEAENHERDDERERLAS